MGIVGINLRDPFSHNTNTHTDKTLIFMLRSYRTEKFWLVSGNFTRMCLALATWGLYRHFLKMRNAKELALCLADIFTAISVVPLYRQHHLFLIIPLQSSAINNFSLHINNDYQKKKKKKTTKKEK